ncbi:hypothetical protein JCM19297_3118 [Nonlabens ulvanivorans]|nr:hypothetical protein JCM19297_3118 [Nonlabens ulvanivorans]
MHFYRLGFRFRESGTFHILITFIERLFANIIDTLIFTKWIFKRS